MATGRQSAGGGSFQERLDAVLALCATPESMFEAAAEGDLETALDRLKSCFERAEAILDEAAAKREVRDKRLEFMQHAGTIRIMQVLEDKGVTASRLEVAQAWSAIWRPIYEFLLDLKPFVADLRRSGAAIGMSERAAPAISVRLSTEQRRTA